MADLTDDLISFGKDGSCRSAIVQVELAPTVMTTNQVAVGGPPAN